MTPVDACRKWMRKHPGATPEEAFVAGWITRARLEQKPRRRRLKTHGYAKCQFCGEEAICWHSKAWGMRCSNCRRKMLLRGEIG